MFKIIKNVKNNIKTSKRGDDIVLFLFKPRRTVNNSNNTNSIYDHTNTYRKYKIRNCKKDWKKYK